MNGDDIICATRTIWGEARGEPYLGQQAVAWVIRNRAEHARWWGGPDFVSVCQAPWQFSCWNPGDPNRDKLLALTIGAILNDAVARQCLRAVLAVADNAVADMTGHATHYVVTDWLADPKLRPSWADELKRTCEIGRHTFFTALEG